MKTNYNLFMLTLYVSMLMISGVYAQGTGNNEPRFATYHTGQAFTSITSDANKNIWAGTTSQGLFFMDQTQQTPTFSVQALGTTPAIGSTRMTSMAKDQSGNIWIAHEGINTTGGQGGIEKINVNTLAVQHFGPGINARGFTVYSEGEGLPTRRVQQIVVDPYNKVWAAHRYHDVTSSPDYIVTPGSICSRMADASGPFENYSTWNDWQNRTTTGIMLERLPYPAYTYNPPVSVSPDSRTVNAISVDSSFIYISVYGYNDSNGVFNSSGNVVPTTYLKPRIIKYTNEAVPQYVREYTTQDARFVSQNGIFNGVYANDKGVWVTTPIAGNGFSVLKNGVWKNITDSSILPPGTSFNRAAIWGDSDGRVYLGTNKGLIVYDGVSDVFSHNAYTLFSKTFYDSYRCVHDPDMLSNTIIAGCVESEESKSYSWIATPDGIMRCNLPLGDFFVYHVEDKEQPFKEKINGNDNYTKFAILKSTSLSYVPTSDGIPSFAADGTTSSVLRLKTDDPGGYYASNSLYRIELRKNTSDVLPGDPNSPEYIARYGKFMLKPIEDYEGQPNVQDLDYVDFIFQHPTHIQGNDFEPNKHYTKYDVFVFKQLPQQTDELIFRHPIKFSLPPVLFGHGVWSDVNILQRIKEFFMNKGYSENEISLAWRLDKEVAENHFYRDAHIIPTYIKSLIKTSLDSKVSAGKVNVIVHSRGGLYTRAYIEEIKPDIEYNNDINALVTLNTPHFGAHGANGALDERVILTGLQKTSLISSVLPQPLASLNLANEILYGPSDPVKIKDLFSGTIPEADKVNSYGAKNLIVEHDYISGGINASTWFVPKLNSLPYRQKMNGIPFHAVATTFSFCVQRPDLCNLNFDSNTFFVIPKRTLQTYILAKSIEYIGSQAFQSIDDFTTYLYGGPNDFVVPRPSMRANLDDQFVSAFPGYNIAHSTLEEKLENPENVVIFSSAVHSEVFEKLKQNFDDSNSNFTKQGIPSYQGLNYTFLAGFQGQTNRQSENLTNNSKIVIHPNSFSSALLSGTTVTFDVYQEDIDNIIMEINSKKKSDISFFLQKNDNLLFQNTFTFEIPTDLDGEIEIIAYGFKEGAMTAIHKLEKVVDLPSNITLQSIRFENPVIEISERNQHRFKLLGMFSDTIEREINDLTGVNYVIEYPMIISQPDLFNIATNIPGQSKLTATIGTLTASTEYVVLEDVALNQTIIADYYADFELTGPIELKWKSLLEFNSSEFILESSIDNSNFTQINQQNALGTSYNMVNYNYIDNTTENIVYYRLKAFDIFNNVVFEETIMVDRNSLSHQDFSLSKGFLIYPNPLNSSVFSVKLNAASDSCDLKLYDIAGNLIFEKKNLITNGLNDFKIELPNQLSEGIYMVQIKTETFVKTEKLIIQK
ncbi:MAG: hypothetical protein CMP76_02465 [Flavobacterium sp.]|uniref:T9SS type A sorting domain-containing protein n=1 Tax=Flavobacterium sp. TaxID=239 RepID=UPI000C35EFF9|nr:T9SS type A sorting domain-containing protein [Flavobacterium sp.]MBF02139.1 hypothetical protein [Flavobacterium sp.]